MLCYAMLRCLRYSYVLTAITGSIGEDRHEVHLL